MLLTPLHPIQQTSSEGWQSLTHTYAKKLFTVYWDSNLTQHPVCLFIKSENCSWEGREKE